MMISHVRSRVSAALLVLTVVPLMATACARGGSSNGSDSSTLGATLVLERFLRAANANDFDTMAQLYGTAEGPFNRMGSQKEIDDRMFVIATVLRHKASAIKGQGDPVTGRRDVALNLVVELTKDDEKVTIPFTMVRYRNGWMVENFPFEKLTGGR